MTEAMRWMEDGLVPLREKMPEADVPRLAPAIRSAVDIEALVWLTDVAGLSRVEAAGDVRWSARAMLGPALADGLPASPERAERGR